MENVQTPHHVSLEEEFSSDPMCQLLERILLTSPFQKSSRLPALLCYLAEHSIRGSLDELTEQRIGTAVFAKPLGYSPAEDSFRANPTLHTLPDSPVLNSEIECKPRPPVLWNILPWIAALVALVCGFDWFFAARADRSAAVPWPVSAIVQNGEQTTVVVSDGSSMLRLLARQQFTLEDYLKPDFLSGLTPPHMDENVGRLVQYISIGFRGRGLRHYLAVA